jgi:hypothetical protein
LVSIAIGLGIEARASEEVEGDGSLLELAVLAGGEFWGGRVAAPSANAPGLKSEADAASVRSGRFFFMELEGEPAAVSRFSANVSLRTTLLEVMELLS